MGKTVITDEKLDEWLGETHGEFMERFRKLHEAVERVDYAGPEGILDSLEAVSQEIEALEDITTEWRGVLDFLEDVRA